MRKLLFGISLFLFACSSPSESSEKGSNCSSISTSGGVVSIDNNFYKSLKNGMVLFVQSKEVVGDVDAISEYKIGPVFPKEDSAAWQIDFSGNEFEVVGNTIRAGELVDNGDFLYTLYNLKSGNEIMSYTYDKFEVLFSDEFEKRFLGFYSQNAASVGDSDFSFNEKSFGFLSYANQQGKISKIRIDAEDEMWMEIFDVANPVIEMIPFKGNAIELNGGKTLYFTGSDGKVSNEVNFDIQFTYYTKDTYKPSSFLLEVRGDKIVVPDDFSNSVFNVESL